MKKIELEFTGVYHKVKLCNKFYLEGICELDMEDRYLYCATDDTKVCGSLCAWFDIENKIRAVDVMGRSLRIKIITCKGIPIGELVEEGK